MVREWETLFVAKIGKLNTLKRNRVKCLCRDGGVEFYAMHF